MLKFCLVGKEGTTNHDHQTVIDIQRRDWEGPVISHGEVPVHSYSPSEGVGPVKAPDRPLPNQHSGLTDNHRFDAHAEEVMEGEGGPPRLMQ